MDLSQAAFGLDMREASRIYFINPVLNPQVEAQAIGRARRVSQKKPVSVETLVLKNSIDEVILERKQHMTQAEHRHVKSILDIRPIYNWIKNTSIEPLAECDGDSVTQMAPFEEAHHVFGRGFGRTLHPDEGLVLDSPSREKNGSVQEPININNASSPTPTNSAKRDYLSGPGDDTTTDMDAAMPAKAPRRDEADLVERPARKVRFAGD